MAKNIQISRNSPATVSLFKKHWGVYTQEIAKIKHGVVVDAVGSTVKLKHTIFKWGDIHLYYCEWYDLNNKIKYEVQIKDITYAY